MLDLTYSLILLLLLLGACLSYAVRTLFRGRAHNARVDAYGGSLFVGKGFLEFGVWALAPVVSLLAWLRITPNQVTVAALLPATAAGVAAASGRFGLAAICSTLAAVSDAVDGMLARKTGKTSEAGKALDSIVDRYMEFLLLGGLAVHFRTTVWSLVIVLSALLGAFMISYSTAKAETLGLQAPRGSMRRAERAIYLVFGCTATPFVPLFTGAAAPFWLLEAPMLAALVIIAVAANISAVYRIAIVIELARKREKDARAAQSDPGMLSTGAMDTLSKSA